MLRPASPEALARLLSAAHDVDRELDTALTVLGVLPPLDLTPIRAWLIPQGVTLHAAANGDGHRVIEVVRAGRVAARIHHDGRVEALDQPVRRVEELASA